MRRPFLLSVITILMMIAGALQVLAGLVLMLWRDNDDLQADSGESSGTILTIGIVALVFGLIHIWIATALRNGNRVARAIIGVVEVLQIVGALWAVIALHGQYRLNGVLTIVVALFVLWYLYGNRRSRAFFGDQV